MKQINLEKIKEYLLKKDNLIILILTGVLLLVIAWPVNDVTTENDNKTGLWDRNSGNIVYNTKQNLEEDKNNIIDKGTKSEYTIENGIIQEEYIVNRLEQRLEDMLSSMQGVGKVKVMVTLVSRGEKVVEKDIPLERSNIVENDSTGGNRSTNEMYSQEETVYSTSTEGDKIPYVIKEYSAVVEGVSVAAQGGDSPLIQKNICEVIQALFGIEAHKIKVVKMKQEE